METPKLFSTTPRRVQIVAPDPIGGRYFKHGQFAYVLGENNQGGMYCIDREGPSKKGETAYLVSKTKEMAGGALWFSVDGLRFTGRKG